MFPCRKVFALFIIQLEVAIIIFRLFISKIILYLKVCFTWNLFWRKRQLLTFYCFSGLYSIYILFFGYHLFFGTLIRDYSVTITQIICINSFAFFLLLIWLHFFFNHCWNYKKLVWSSLTMDYINESDPNIISLIELPWSVHLKYF